MISHTATTAARRRAPAIKLYSGKEPAPMAPLRTAAGGSLLAASGAPGLVSPTLATLGSALAAAWHPWIGLALLGLVVVQWLDIYSGTRAARKLGTYRAARRRLALADKLLRDSQIIGFVVIDVILIGAGATSMYIFTGGAIGFLLRDELRSYRRNMRIVLGKDAVWGEGFDDADDRLAALTPAAGSPPRAP
jgi:hypothetical protein